jgi:hypothetical protein
MNQKTKKNPNLREIKTKNLIYEFQIYYQFIHKIHIHHMGCAMNLDLIMNEKN